MRLRHSSKVMYLHNRNKNKIPFVVKLYSNTIKKTIRIYY
jgi:hypothetical protein